MFVFVLEFPCNKIISPLCKFSNTFSVISSDKIKPFVLENLFLNCLAQEIYSDIFQYYEIVIPWATENDEISTSRSRLTFQTVSINESENLLIRAQQFRKIESLRKKKKDDTEN